MTNFEIAHDIVMELLGNGYIAGMDEGLDQGLLTEIINHVEQELNSHNVVCANGFDGTWG